MRILIPILSFLFLQQVNSQQFKFDNVSYTTVFPEDICRLLKENPEHILLDVRSNGEYYDTSTSSYSLNIGRMKNATHIPVNELASRWQELVALKDNPIFIYCSHSQRSRRASKMLADSGFTKIYNVNGGLTRLLFIRKDLPECFNKIYTNQLAYKILSPAEVMQAATKENPFYIIDLRPDSLFKGISSNEKRNSMGRLEGSHNIFLTDVENSLSQIPQDKQILLVDEFGNESPQAANLLVKYGYSNINILFNGIDEWIDQEMEEGNNSVINRIYKIRYTILSDEQFDKMASSKKCNIIDIRSKEHFNNQSKNYWENLGRIKGSVNIPANEIGKSNLLPEEKNTALVLYSFNNQSEVFESALLLTKMGYKNVNILRGGIWNLRWSAYNLKDKSGLKNWIINVPEENQ